MHKFKSRDNTKPYADALMQVHTVGDFVTPFAVLCVYFDMNSLADNVSIIFYVSMSNRQLSRHTISKYHARRLL